jgi:glycosyl transferase family 25
VSITTIPVFVISLACSFERRNHSIDQLKRLGVSYQIVEAFDGNQISDFELYNNPEYGLWEMGSRTRHLNKGEIGCVLSHFKVYQKMVDDDIKVACILEDDAILQSEFKDFLNPENLDSFHWDLFYLGHHSRFSKKEAWCKNMQELKLKKFSAGEPIELPGGSYGYIIKCGAATEILRHGYPIRKSLDHYTGNAPALGIKTFLLSPPCVNHNYQFKTTIAQDSDIRYRKSPVELFRSQFRKAYKWLPFLQTFRVWINTELNLFLRFLRKKGIFKNSYAKY